ncbi:hypothetical protein LCGC14_1914270, partial [marine sediment metagenome]
PTAKLANVSAAALRAIRDVPLSGILRPVDELEIHCQALTQQSDDKAANRIEQQAQRLKDGITAAVSKGIATLGIRPVKHQLEDRAGALREVDLSLAAEIDAVDAQLEAADHMLLSIRRQCQRRAAKWYRRGLARVIRRDARRAADLVLHRTDLRLLRQRQQRGAELLGGAIVTLEEETHRLAQADVDLVRRQRAAIIGRRKLSESNGRLPHFHVRPSLAETNRLADQVVFSSDVFENMVHRVASEWTNGNDLGAGVSRAAQEAVRSAALPRGIVSDLAAMASLDRQRLLVLLNDEAGEAATVSALEVPAQRRWRLRVLRVPGGEHSEIAEPMEQINPEGVNSRVIDTGYDPATFSVTFEERALCAPQIVEIRRAEQLMRQASPDQCAAALTVWQYGDEVAGICFERAQDLQGAQKLMVAMLALDMVKRDGSGTYRLTDESLLVDHPDVTDGRIGKGYDGTIRRIARDRDFRRAITSLVSQRRGAIGEKEVWRRMRGFLSRVRDMVPGGSVTEVKAMVTQELKDKAAVVVDCAGAEVPRP